MDMEKVRQFVELTERKRKLDADLKTMKDILGLLEPALVEAFTAEGVKSVKLEGKTIFLHRQLWAGVEPGRMPEVCVAMKALGLSDIVKEGINTQTLSSWARELPRDDDDMPVFPPELGGSVKADDRVNLRMWS